MVGCCCSFFNVSVSIYRKFFIMYFMLEWKWLLIWYYKIAFVITSCFLQHLCFLFASIFRSPQISMDDEDFPRGKRRKLGTDAEVKEVKSTPLDKELFSEVNFDFII